MLDLIVVDDLERKADEDNLDFLTADKLERLNRKKDNNRKSGFLTDEKLKSIMSFLDEVETAERISEIDQVTEWHNLSTQVESTDRSKEVRS